MANTSLDTARSNMKKSIAVFERDLGGIRAGRANASLLDRVNVEYYGAPTPLNQIAAITIPEPRVLLVNPYDKTALGDIEKGILSSYLGITPANDGDVIRIVIPQLTSERRQEIAKEVGKLAEQAKVAVRNVRRDFMDDLKKSQKNGDISEDEMHDSENELQNITNNATKEIDQLAAEKSKEITEG